MGRAARLGVEVEEVTHDDAVGAERGRRRAARGDRRQRAALLKVPEGKAVKNRLHLDLRPDDQDAEVARAEAIGATPRRHRPGRGHVGRARRPEGNEFCILGPFRGRAAGWSQLALARPRSRASSSWSRSAGVVPAWCTGACRPSWPGRSPRRRRTSPLPPRWPPAVAAGGTGMATPGPMRVVDGEVTERAPARADRS